MPHRPSRAPWRPPRPGMSTGEVTVSAPTPLPAPLLPALGAANAGAWAPPDASGVTRMTRRPGAGSGQRGMGPGARRGPALAPLGSDAHVPAHRNDDKSSTLKIMQLQTLVMHKSFPVHDSNAFTCACVQI